MHSRHDSKRINVIFIHELTHVWQGFHGVNFVAPPCSTNVAPHLPASPLIYTSVGKNWSQYNVEQQGKIVEDWFNPTKGNMSAGNNRFRYIRDNIRRGLIAP